MPAKGACGATTIAWNLAARWKKASNQRILLADLDALTGTSSKPIADYGLLADCNSVGISGLKAQNALQGKTVGTISDAAKDSVTEAGKRSISAAE